VTAAGPARHSKSAWRSKTNGGLPQRVRRRRLVASCQTTPSQGRTGWMPLAQGLQKSTRHSASLVLGTRRSGGAGCLVGSERSRIAPGERKSAAVTQLGNHTCFYARAGFASGTRFAGFACLMPSAAADLPSAESEHASGGVLAAPLLTIGPKRKSTALSAGFSNVAHAATWPSLPLRSATASEQQSTSAPLLPLTWAPVRESGSVALATETPLVLKTRTHFRGISPPGAPMRSVEIATRPSHHGPPPQPRLFPSGTLSDRYVSLSPPAES
jgi:hypothetical protein